jgi:nucleoside-diphosphate-sugar epimerase
MEAPAEQVERGLFNIAAGGRHSLNDLLREIGEILGVEPRAEHGPARQGDIRHSQADITLAQEVLGYEARVSFREGLKRTVAYFREAGEAA